MRVLLRVIWWGYWILLTVLLLAPDPYALLGLPHALGPSGRGVHLAFFCGLAVLAQAPAWPVKPSRLLLAALLAYGLAAETLQYFVPQRTVGLFDYTENMLGILCGWGGYMLVRRCFGKWPRGTAESRRTVLSLL